MSLNDHKLIVFTKTYAPPKRVRSWALAHGSSWEWIYLSDDYLKLKQWRQELGDGFSYIHIDQELELSAQQLKKPYLRWLAQLGNNHPEEAWWASRVSERNTAVSPLFENICRLNVMRKLLEKSEQSIVIVSDSPSLIDTLSQAEWLEGRKKFRLRYTKISSILSIDFTKKFLLNSRFVKPILFTLRISQLIKQIIQAKIARSKALPVNEQNIVMLHTYLDEATFTPDYIFRDRYFPGLDIVLKKQGFEVLILPVMAHINRSLCRAWSWTKSSTTHFVNPYKLYHFTDYIFALRIAYRTSILPLGSLIFKGHNLTLLVQNEARISSFSMLDQILYLRLPLRLQENKIKCVALVAEFENMIPEKMLIQGFRSYQPHTELIGFQHGALYPNLLCNFIPLQERAIAPMYDRIVCNGPLFRDILVAEGLAPEIAVVGSALRYKHLWTKKVLSDSKKKITLIDIFVPLPLMMPAGVELLDKLLAAFSCETKLRVVLKPHPMMNVKSLLKAAGISTLPPHFQFTNDAMNLILPRARLMVGLSTCTMFEAVAAGLPVVRLRRETALDLDPLAFLGDFSPTALSAVELSQTVKRLLKLSSLQRDEVSREGRKILARAFRPCNEAGLSAFIPSRSLSKSAKKKLTASCE